MAEKRTNDEGRGANDERRMMKRVILTLLSLKLWQSVVKQRRRWEGGEVYVRRL